MKLFLRIFMILFCLLLLVFFGGVAYEYVTESNAWKNDGFYACAPGSHVRLDTIEINADSVHLVGAVYAEAVSAKMDTYSRAGNLSYNASSSATPGYLGYVSEIRDGVLYIGIAASDFFGKLGTDNLFDITVPTDGSISAVSIARATDKSQEKLSGQTVWTVHKDIALTAEEQYGLQIERTEENDITSLYTISKSQVEYFFTDMTYTHIIEQWPQESYYTASFIVKDAEPRWLFINKETGAVRIGSLIGVYTVNPTKAAEWQALLNSFTVSVHASDYTPYGKILTEVNPLGLERPGNICLSLPDAHTGRDYMSIGVSSSVSPVELSTISSVIELKRKNEITLSHYRRIPLESVELLFSDGTYILWSDSLDRLVQCCKAVFAVEAPADAPAESLVEPPAEPLWQ